MKAMLLKTNTLFSEVKNPLEYVDMQDPVVSGHEVLLEVLTCGVCHTELDEIEGRAIPSFFPIILGHQVVGKIIDKGSEVTGFGLGDRVGAGWFYSSCGKCKNCLNGNDNLCSEFRATGRDANGGFAEFMKIPYTSVFPIPPGFTDEQAAPLLCAGAIGYRSLRLANLKNGENLGLTGFGASAHLVLKLAKSIYPASKIFVFARSPRERNFANELGAAWSGDTTDDPGEKLSAVIDTTPVWKPVLEAMKNLEPGGRLVINAIRKEDSDKNELVNLDYAKHLWMEKEIKTVANVARRDIREFLDIAGKISILPETELYAMKDANHALLSLKEGKIRGAKVLVMK